jgi:hypothetical protein
VAQFKNTSKLTFERPGDGKKSPGWTAAPGDIVDADSNPLPGAFTEVDPQPEPQPEPAAAEQTPAAPAS